LKLGRRRTGGTSPTIPESHRHLLDAPVAVRATIGSDGRPQATRGGRDHAGLRHAVDLTPYV
jgi:hypothetical protein